MTLGAGSRCQESTVITFEWDLMGLKEIFETSKDDEKSPLIASSVFGGGRWQLHFYASAARASSCSLYIAAVPTPEELSLGAQTCLSQGGWPREGPQWSRKGPFSFTFEIKSLDGTIPIVARGPYEPMARKEFTSNCSTWGYPQYVRRTEIFGERAIAKANNGVKIICTMTYPLASVSVLAQPSTIPTSRPISPEIIDTMVDLFDNPAHSDVVFKFPNRHGPGYKSLYASKKVLARRSEYFKSMFEGGFAESSYSSSLDAGRLSSVTPSRLSSRYTASHLKLPARPSVLDDLDDVDDDDSDADSDYDAPSEDECEFMTAGSMEVELPRPASPISDHRRQVTYLQSCDGDDVVRPMTPESAHSDSDESSGGLQPLVRSTVRRPMAAPAMASSMQVVIVRDTAYLTYRALIFSLYTDDTTFGPLASTYHTDRTSANKNGTEFPYTSRRSYVQSRITPPKAEARQKSPLPCSPKSLYKLADRLDLPLVKKRAFHAIKNSLNPRNVATELFGNFSSLFPEVRKIELDYLLGHWEEVSHSDTLMYDMNPFHPSSPMTPGFGSRSRPSSARHNRLHHQISTTNQDIFVQLLQSLRPKSRRSMTGPAGATMGPDGDEDDTLMDGHYSL
ncbi:hypothetical protein FRB96_008455 [Tulasnella sp. 330]|nr:hypothetical protein FRB96_008455 [Tulasnella sp. 330]KAG8883978.1 hypothetical protein FRB97_005422 [Tulasnella sp. 331]KAG8889303.1 hypothetical protein FRB98_004920 [Tulasnella sp. 332]